MTPHDRSPDADAPRRPTARAIVWYLIAIGAGWFVAGSVLRLQATILALPGMHAVVHAIHDAHLPVGYTMGVLTGTIPVFLLAFVVGLPLFKFARGRRGWLLAGTVLPWMGYLGYWYSLMCMDTDVSCFNEPWIAVLDVIRVPLGFAVAALVTRPSSGPAGGWRSVLGAVAGAVLLGTLFATPWAAVAAEASPQEQVFAAERAFAKTMSDRDLSAFSGYVADEAIFFTRAEPLRGKPAVVAAWSRFFEGPQAPFSWAPDRVEVLPSGTLALSTGLVRDPGGKVVGRFNSVWRQESPGVWRVVFDKGSPAEPADKQ
jgi:ketosteroid isomerase-like protein